MSDFGTDVGNSSLSLMGKMIEALLKLIEKIYGTIQERTSAEYKLKKAEYGVMKDKAAKQKFVEKIEGKTGFVNHKDLVKAGIPLIVVGVTLDERSMKELSDRCKREGIVITGVEDIRERELKGNKSFVLECKQSDLTKLAKLIDLMNDEKKIDKINDEISKLEARNAVLKQEAASIREKGSELSQDDKDRLIEIENEIEENNLVADELFNQVEYVRYGHSQELNQEQAQGVCEKAVNDQTNHGVMFDEAINHWTGGSIDKDTTCYVVDAKDPDKYIVCNARNDTYRGNDYIKTTYEVYNGNQQLYATNDKRFDGRPKDYWTREKAAMKDVGGFSDLVIKFYSIKELEAYREKYKTQNASELDKLEVGKEGRDYESIIKSLETKLEECGAAFKDGIVVNKETGKELALTEGMSYENRANIAEASVISKQIVNYKEISQLESDVAIARTNVLTTNEGTPEHEAAKAEFEKVESKYKAVIETEASLIDERKSVNAVQAEQEVKTSPTKSLEFLQQDKKEIEALEAKITKAEAHNYDFGQQEVSKMRSDLEKMKAQAVKNAQSAEKPDDRRDDRVAEVEDDKRTMAEYKGEIADRKKGNGAKGNDVKDREATKQNAVPKGKEDRQS